MGHPYTLYQAIHGSTSESQMALDTYAAELRTQVINASRMFNVKVQKQLLTQDVCRPRLLVAADCTGKTDAILILSLYRSLSIFYQLCWKQAAG